MMWFCLASVCDPALALQAAAHSGQPLTLQPLDSADPRQHWQIRLHSASQIWGLVFVNRATGMAVSYSGNLQALLMRRYAAAQHEQSVWYVTATAQRQIFRIALAANAHIVWAATEQRCAAGVIIQSYDVALTGDSALWTMRLLS